MAIIFNGQLLAEKKRLGLSLKVKALAEKGRALQIAAVLFEEDPASQIYSRLKKEMAESLGIDYQLFRFSFATPVATLQKEIQKLSNDPQVTGIIIQKPWTAKWLNFFQEQLPDRHWQSQDFQQWWQSLVQEIATEKSHGVNKDIDGLHPETLGAIEEGSWFDKGMVLPATVRAIFSTIKFYRENHDPDFCFSTEKTAVIGRSDLVGRPLYWQIHNELTGRFPCPIVARYKKKTKLLDQKKEQNDSVNFQEKEADDCELKLLGKKEFNSLIDQEKLLKDFTVIIAATGQKNLIKKAYLSTNVFLIDVGEPVADIEAGAAQQARFFTPVPGGIGPMTVVSLMANVIDLQKRFL